MKTHETLKYGSIHKFKCYCNFNLNLKKYKIENSIIMEHIGTSTDFAVFSQKNRKVPRDPWKVLLIKILKMN